MFVRNYHLDNRLMKLNKVAALTIRVAAASLDFSGVNTKHPPTGPPHIRLVRNVNNLVGSRSRNAEESNTVTGIEACLSMKERNSS